MDPRLRDLIRQEPLYAKAARDWPAPSPEMIRLSRTYGGMPEDGPVMPDLFGNAAVTSCRALLRTFEGYRNPNGDELLFDIQHFLDERPTALCAPVGGRHCIATFFGLHMKILEIAFLAVGTYFELASRWPREFYDAMTLGRLYEEDAIERAWATPDTSTHFELMMRSFGERELDAVVYLTNYLTQFVIFHEANHATGGHALYMKEHRALPFLAESLALYDVEDVDPVQIHFELAADHVSLLLITSEIVDGTDQYTRAGEDNPPADEKLPLVWLGHLLLAFTWLRNDVINGWKKAHPYGTDRIVNLLYAPYDAPVASEARPLVDGAYGTVVRLVSMLCERDPGFQPIADAATACGRDRYQALRQSKDSKAIADAFGAWRRLSFFSPDLPPRE